MRQQTRGARFGLEPRQEFGARESVPSSRKKDQADNKKDSKDQASSQPGDKSPDQKNEGQPTALAEGRMTPQQRCNYWKPKRR